MTTSGPASGVNQASSQLRGSKGYQVPLPFSNRRPKKKPCRFSLLCRHPPRDRQTWQTTAEEGVFVTDTFRVNKRLTLTYGLRWDYFATPLFSDGMQYTWSPTSGDVIVPSAALTKISPLHPTTIPVVTGQAVPSPSLHNFAPRVAVAYQLSDRRKRSSGSVMVFLANSPALSRSRPVKGLVRFRLRRDIRTRFRMDSHSSVFQTRSRRPAPRHLLRASRDTR